MRLAPTLPEEIIQSPSFDYQPWARTVRIHPFEAPVYAPTAGPSASRHLYDVLLKSRIFANVILALDAPAEENDCDWVITGEVLYFLDGSDLGPSRVDQRIRVTDVARNAHDVLWEAIARDISRPIGARDLLFFELEGVPAQPAAELLRRNAVKFAWMLRRPPEPETEEDASRPPSVK